MKLFLRWDKVNAALPPCAGRGETHTALEASQTSSVLSEKDLVDRVFRPCVLEVSLCLAFWGGERFFLPTYQGGSLLFLLLLLLLSSSSPPPPARSVGGRRARAWD